MRSHAATGPHIAGMDLGDPDPLTGPAGCITAMGIDLVATVDAAAAERPLPGPGRRPLVLLTGAATAGPAQATGWVGAGAPRLTNPDSGGDESR